MNPYQAEFDAALHQSMACAQKYMASLEHLEDVALRVAQWARYSQDKTQPKMEHLTRLHGYWQEVQQNRRYWS